MKEDISQLKKDIAEIERYIDQLEKQQLTFPLDEESKKIAYKNLIVPTGKTNYPSVSTGYGTQAIEFIVRGIRYLISAK